MPESPAPLRPIDLRTERAIAPIGIDEPHPLLSWRLTGLGNDRYQRSYQIIVSTDDDQLWDSGMVESSDSVDIAYDGPPLRPRTRYDWRVRVTDELGQDSGWSEPARWETGLGDTTNWAASWITRAGELLERDRPNLDFVALGVQIRRIWATSCGDSARFRAVLDIPPRSSISGANFCFGGAEDISVSVNGVAVSVGSEIPSLLNIGPNAIAVEARRGGGLVGRIDIQREGAPPITLATDDTWLAASEENDEWVAAEALDLHGHPPLGREPITHRPSPYLRREFDIDDQVVRARLYVTALGIYEIWINGERVGTDYLAPGWTDYHTRIPYQTYDVTDKLRQGDNAIGAIVADGWYAGNVSWHGQFHYGRHRAVRAELAIELDTGRTLTIVTDTEWRAGQGSIRYADLQNGEIIDAREEPHGWSQPGFDPSWGTLAVAIPGPAGIVESAVAEPVRIQHQLPAQTITEQRPGVWIVDFGQNMVGRVRLRATGGAGQRIFVRHAEVLDVNGELYVDALRGARATDEFILAGKSDGETFEPQFTFHGFRYAEVSGYPGELTADDITGIVTYADMEPTGEFTCSNEPLNQLQRNIVWGLRGNFLSVPTDCPQRDERLGWTGDVQVFAPTAAFNYDVRSILRKWLLDVRDAQQPSGAVSHVAPDVLPQQAGLEDVHSGSAGWGDAIAIVPATLLSTFGDRRTVIECLDAIGGWLEFLDRRGTVDTGFADWLAIVETPKRLVNMAFFAHVARLAAQLARYVDQKSDADRWDGLANRARRQFRTEFVRGGGRVESGTQTAYVLALQFGLLDEPERPRAVQRLVADIESRVDHLTTGFLGTPWLLDALTDGGRIDVAYRLLMQDTYPSWLYPVVHGNATTMWERWDSWSDSWGFANPNMTSFNHYAYGAVGDWIYRTVGGIRAIEPGYRRFLVAPQPGGGLTSATTRLSTVYGEILSSWRTDGELFQLDVTVPVNTTAEIRVPDESGVHTVGSGNYQFRSEISMNWKSTLEMWALDYCRRLAADGHAGVILGGSIARGQQWEHSDLEVGYLRSAAEDKLTYFAIDSGRGVERISLEYESLESQVAAVEAGDPSSVAGWPIQLYRGRVQHDPSGLLARFSAMFDRYLFTDVVVGHKIANHLAAADARIHLAQTELAAGRPSAALAHLRWGFNDVILVQYWRVRELPRSQNRTDSRLRDLAERHSLEPFYHLYRDIYHLNDADQVIAEDWPSAKTAVLDSARLGPATASFFDIAVDGTFSWGANGGILGAYRMHIPILGNPPLTTVLDNPAWRAKNERLVRFLGFTDADDSAVASFIAQVDATMEGLRQHS